MNATAVPPGPATAARIRSARFWSELFRANLQREWPIPWASTVHLFPDERGRIARSIAEFQRGESSEARCYLAKSAAFAARAGDATFHQASMLFIQEEHRHSALLGRFMRAEGIATREAFFTDAAFRWLRSLSDIGWTSRVILVAEVIAQEYYPCLRAATGHPVLVGICDKVISDEAAHVRFQVERIVRVEATVGRGDRLGREAAHTLLMAGTAVLVYLEHRHALAARLGFGAFCRRVWIRNRRALATMRALRAAEAARRWVGASRPV